MFSRRNSWLLFAFAALLCSKAAADNISITNLNAIAINDGGGVVIPDAATPYPASNVALAPPGWVVSKVSVRLRALSHDFPSDVAMLLQGPEGQTCILMAETGGQSQFSVSNIDITFDDNAAAPLPIYTTLTSGTFKPTNGYLSLHYPTLPYDFPAPAPAGNSNSVPALKVFTGTNPNGQWNLFVVDDAGGNQGHISGGWILNISTAIPLNHRTSGSNLVLSWPSSISGCTLQGTGSPAGPWTNFPPVSTIVNGQYTVTNHIGSGSAFFRLLH